MWLEVTSGLVVERNTSKPFSTEVVSEDRASTVSSGVLVIDKGMTMVKTEYCD